MVNMNPDQSNFSVPRRVNVQNMRQKIMDAYRNHQCTFYGIQNANIKIELESISTL